MAKSASSVIGDGARFVPGIIIADRYRVIAKIGRGGMGEVYRADDLRLGHPVALKFLPTSLARDARLLARFHAEVRNSRQLSHPNVCRVYDIGEVSGQHFLTMEYIDGEDLASLLRRIGRLPADKALEIAHQLCGGLAAAHDNGLLHRDLKPANIMLDGRGRARITDFGLAVPVDDAGACAEFAGTPAYMAPEQRAGGAASVRSDIYSLGLVLFEIFTGKRAFEEENLADWRASQTPTASQRGSRLASSVTGDVGPTVKRAILRCLETDPARRPASALQVVAALPGGDPLAAAVAAGETPSPEMVAAAGDEAAIAPRSAVLLGVSIVVLLAAMVPLGRRSHAIGLAPNIKSPDALTERAQEIARRAGYTDSPADTFSTFQQQTEFMRYQAANVPSPARYRQFATVYPNPHRFLYIQSPHALLPNGPIQDPSWEDPSPAPGAVFVAEDGEGRLVRLMAIPPELDKEAPPTPAQPDWPAMFAEAGLDIRNFQPSTPRIIPATAFDARAAWEGKVGEVPFHIDAASFRGKPVDFFVRGPWNPDSRPVQETPAPAVGIAVVFLFVLPAVGLLFAIHNLRMGRADVRGATKLGSIIAGTVLLASLLGQHWAAHANILRYEFLRVAAGFLLAATAWVSYVALEPLLRRHSPHLLIGWTRLFDGRLTDARVGRDLLVGVAGGMLFSAIRAFGWALPWWFDVPSVTPMMSSDVLRPTEGFLATLIGIIPYSLWSALLIAVLLAFFRVITRRQWIAIALLYGVMLAPNIGGGIFGNAAVGLAMWAMADAVLVAILARYGLLAFASMSITEELLLFPTPRFGTWYVARPLMSMGLLLAMTALALCNVLRGRQWLTRLIEGA